MGGVQATWTLSEERFIPGLRHNRPDTNKTMWKFLRYITNNEAQSRHEEVFDVIFWTVETLALCVGIWILLVKHDGEWIPFLVIEYCWAMDNLRHNRP